LVTKLGGEWLRSIMAVSALKWGSVKAFNGANTWEYIVFLLKFFSASDGVNSLVKAGVN